MTSLLRGDAIRLPLRAESVDLIVTSPPYFALRSYRDGGEHYDGQIGSEETPQAFLEALWAVTAECWRVLKPTGSLFVNLGDKYAGSGGHNNAGISSAGSTLEGTKQQDRGGKEATSTYRGNALARARASRRTAPDRYNQSSEFEPMHMGNGVGRQMVPGRTKGYVGVRPKSLLGLPWRYAIGCIDQGWILRAEIVWSKLNGLPESVKDRVKRSHEQWFHLTKEGSYFANIDEIRQPYSAKTWTTVNAGADCASADADSQHAGHRKNAWAAEKGLTRGETMNPLGVLPGSVWELATEPLTVPDHLDVDHFAAFPQEWPRRLILGWSPPGGVVLDPFVGTGTVPMVARSLGRYGIGLDLSADYLRLARWRVFESGHAAKSIRRTNGERQGVLV